MVVGVGLLWNARRVERKRLRETAASGHDERTVASPA